MTLEDELRQAQQMQFSTGAYNNNESRKGSHRLRSLRKHVAGDGYALAAAVCPRNMQVPALPADTSLEVGDPLTKTVNVETLDDEAILLAIRFYNLNFEIKPRDSLYVRRLKFANWLCGVSIGSGPCMSTRGGASSRWA